MLSAVSRDLVAIIGAGGHAKVVIEALCLVTADVELVILDDAQGSVGRRLLDKEVTAGRGWAERNRARLRGVVPAVGDNRARAEIVRWASECGLPLLSVIHPTAAVSSSASIGDGCFLAAGVVVNAEARLGRAVIVNSGASVDHDCDIGEAVHIAPGVRLCGNVRVGPRTLLGTASVVVPGIKVGADAVVGAGSVVLKDLPDQVRVAGNPARPIGA